ncbi:winged helix DNA-binding protein [Mesorhizobium sp.]|uniref:MarR family winged helix-turn-helix transcriptional regulator n=1 Tax=Mesorhizobium sp. TaxID=1871066 RepID=UPI001218F5BC|nr:winged helix DNA-binding protein [Mesorhizobium sp.]TIS56822.1 MAG: MarR family transcriptional regulator [Mesorhizobium sp.]TIS87498.1 MAG: MarR family transcriptional regulator [Mesorhizobium sp.]TJW44527.1 MAG: MarR family transcriptional regulator [Mesorhizobium sp.]
MKPEEELRFLILGAQREGNRLLTDLLIPLGITSSQAEVISCLKAGGPMSLNALGKLLVCETGSPSRLVGTMVERGLVARRENADDRRQVELELTQEGLRLAVEIRQVEARLYGWLGQRLTPQEITTAVCLLRALIVGTAAGKAIAQRNGQLSHLPKE